MHLTSSSPGKPKEPGAALVQGGAEPTAVLHVGGQLVKLKTIWNLVQAKSFDLTLPVIK